MRYIVIFLIMYSFIGSAQDSSGVFSIYFDANANPGTKKLNEISAQYYHRYSLVGRNDLDLRVASGDHLIVDELGIYLEKNRLLSISRTEIRENPAYHLNNGYLHGVVANDSVLVALDGESYYFLLPTKTFLYEVNGKTSQLYQGRSPNEYLIFSPEEKGALSILMINFNGTEITLAAIDLDQVVFDFRGVTGTKISTGAIPLYILSPTKTEWKEILNHFVIYDRYKEIG